MTTLLRWNPLLSRSRDTAALRDEFDRLFDNLIPSLAAPGASAFTPSTDVHETAEAFVIRFDLPGISQKDVKVTIMGDTLSIRGERKSDESREQGSLHLRERRYGSFERAFTLTSPVRADQVRATYRDGVLEVHVPKADEARTREVEIQIG